MNKLTRGGETHASTGVQSLKFAATNAGCLALSWLILRHLVPPAWMLPTVFTVGSFASLTIAGAWIEKIGWRRNILGSAVVALAIGALAWWMAVRG